MACLAQARRGPRRLSASPNIRTFIDPQDPTRVTRLMDVADMDVVTGAMQSKRWQMP